MLLVNKRRLFNKQQQQQQNHRICQCTLFIYIKNFDFCCDLRVFLFLFLFLLRFFVVLNLKNRCLLNGRRFFCFVCDLYELLFLLYTNIILREIFVQKKLRLKKKLKKNYYKIKKCCL